MIVWLLLGLVGALYVTGVRRTWGAVGTRRQVVAARTASFVTGLVVVGVALASPLDARAAELFSVHMAQHVLLALVAAPLVALGAPMWPLARALPSGARRPFGRLDRVAGSGSGGALLGWWALFVGGFWFWHMPAVYDAAVGSSAVHALQHATMFWTAFPFWWTVLRRGRRYCWHSIGVLLATFAIDATGGMVFALADTPIYSSYLESVTTRGTDPVEDVRLGGAFMAIGSMVYLGAAGWLFTRWLAHLHDPRPRGGALVGAAGAGRTS